MDYFEKKVLEVVEREEKQRPPHDGEPSLFISDATKCSRMRWLKFFRYPEKERTPSEQRLFKIGLMIEEWLINKYQRAGVVRRLGEYVRHHIDPRVRGKTDITLIDEDTKDILSEVKSVNSKKFWYRRKEVDPFNADNEKKDGYAAQGLNYVWTFIKQKKYTDLKPVVLITEISRDDLAQLDSRVELTDTWKKVLEEDWNTVLKAVDLKKIPPPIKSFPNEYQCQKCDFRESCLQVFSEEHGLQLDKINKRSVDKIRN